MYKIYINDIELILVAAADYNRFFKTNRGGNRGLLECSFQSKEDFLFLIETLEKATDLQTVIVIGGNTEEMMQNFSSHYKIIEAAGGLVRNERGEILMMMRNGKWDLPKGKTEKMETHLHAALREVEEETGLENLKAKTAIRFTPFKQKATLHTYILKNKRILKYTFWFLMEVRSEQKLTPQKEEGITKIEWVDVTHLSKYLKNTYGNIKDILMQVSEGN